MSVDHLSDAALERAGQFNAALVPANQKVLFSNLAHVRGDVVMVSIDDIQVIDGFNVRIPDEALQAHILNIAQSIKQHGFKQSKPLAGYAGKLGTRPVLYLTDGHCRLAAARIAIEQGAPLSEVPVYVQDKSTTEEDITANLILDNEGRHLTPLEKSIVCKRLVHFGWTPQRIAAHVGFTPEYVGQLLTIAGAPRSVREMIQSGACTVGVALQVMREHGEQAPAVLDGALAQARDAGKSRLTRQHLPDQLRKKAIARQAPRMFEALSRVSSHKSFVRLPADLKTLIEEILASAPGGDAPEPGPAATPR